MVAAKMNILINAHYNLVGEVSPAELGRALLWYVADLLGLDEWDEIDTDGTNIMVDGYVVTSTRPTLVSLIEAANLLINHEGR